MILKVYHKKEKKIHQTLFSAPEGVETQRTRRRVFFRKRRRRSLGLKQNEVRFCTDL